MCGILGLHSYDKNINDPENFKNLLSITKSRGPDSKGIYKSDNFIFGINRLAIVDKLNGDQPISTEDGRFTIIFNGELYNFKEIRKQLIEKKNTIYNKLRHRSSIKIVHRVGQRLFN